ncbi:MAG: hypothetical protein V4813_15575 [Gemmatimonadota bacterium]
MMRRQRTLFAGAIAAMCTLAPVVAAQVSPRTLVTRAIAAAGGARAARAASAIEWSGSATVHAGGRTVEIRGRWRVAPDTAVSTTWMASQDSSAARSLVVAGERGWLVRAGTATAMPADMLTEERHQFHLYELLRLVPLLESPLTLEGAPPDSAGNAAVLVRSPDYPDVTMYFDAAHRLVRMVTTFAAPGGALGARQELRLTGQVRVGGFRWFRQLDIRRDGQPYFTLRIDRAHRATGLLTEWLRLAGVPPA